MLGKSLLRVASYTGRERPRLLDRPNNVRIAAMDTTRKTLHPDNQGFASGRVVRWKSRAKLHCHQNHIAQAACALVDVALRYIRWVALRVSCASFGDAMVPW